jgi:predicted secreted hydrolase
MGNGGWRGPWRCAVLAGLFAALPSCDSGSGARASLSVAETLGSADTAGYARAVEPPDLVFPRDHGPHPAFRHEWWYFTGNLSTVGPTGSRREFGFQLTIFRNALRPDSAAGVASEWSTRQAFMGHFALTEITDGGFHAFERFDRGAVGLAGARADPVRVWIGDWSIALDGSDPAAGEYPTFTIRAEEGGVGLALDLVAEKPVVLQGDRGLSPKGPEPGNASHYYSFTRLRAGGTVTTPGGTRAVQGFAWLDREWSTSALSPGVVGWDWFALQLDDESELMVYRLREEDGGTAPFSAGTFVGPEGRVTKLGADDFALEASGRWTSPRGGAYPSGWRIRVPSLSLDLEVQPRLPDQELDLAFRYWEGAVEVRGRSDGATVAGRGYVELTGYAEAPVP